MKSFVAVFRRAGPTGAGAGGDAAGGHGPGVLQHRAPLRLEKQTLKHLQEMTEARQELKDLSAKLVATQENERKSISRDLHDAVGQSMSAVQFELHDLALALRPYDAQLARAGGPRPRAGGELAGGDSQHGAAAAALDAGRPGTGGGARLAGARDLAAHRAAHSGAGRRLAGRSARRAQDVRLPHRAGGAQQRRQARQCERRGNHRARFRCLAGGHGAGRRAGIPARAGRTDWA